MAQKLFEPFKKLPQKIQNMPLFQKLQDLTSGRHVDLPHLYDASIYGISSIPIGFDYDQDLCLLAVAYESGHLSVYGAPGISFSTDCLPAGIKLLRFLRNEGRLVVATCESLFLLELDTIKCRWIKKSSVDLPLGKEEKITAFAVGIGVLYIGSSSGILRQVAVDGGLMSVGDDELTALPSHVILNNVSEDKRDQLNLSSPIVSIEVREYEKQHLLIGYSGGTVVIADPQPIPILVEDKQIEIGEQTEPSTTENIVEDAEINANTEENLETNPKANEDEIIASVAPVKEEVTKSNTVEKKKDYGLLMRTEATKKFRSLSKTIRNTIIDRPVEKLIRSSLSVPPIPHVTHILPYTQSLCCATWHVSSTDKSDPEVLTSYDDGAYLSWKLTTPSEGLDDPIIVTYQDNASIPYGPLPCSAIQKIMTRPSVNGDIVKSFVGGLPRAQYPNRHTLSVLCGQDEHVCFLFGSPILDFMILPRPTIMHKEMQQSKSVELDAADVDLLQQTSHSTTPSTPTEAAYILVLTEKELVAIDLTQPGWPVIPSPYLQCLGCVEITTVAHVSIHSDLLDKLRAPNAPEKSFPFMHWPIQGGRLCPDNAECGEDCSGDLSANKHNDLLAIGHIDGTVSIWSLARGDVLLHLYTINSLEVLNTEGIICNSKLRHDEETWPPFRLVGDCATSLECCRESCDSRLAIHCLSLQIVNNELLIVIGGAAGQVSLWSTAKSIGYFEPDIARIHVDLLSEKKIDEEFIWDGSKCLNASEVAISQEQGTFTPCQLIQLYPPSPITVAVLESKWQCLAIGSDYGYGLIDLMTNSVVFKNFTYGLPISTWNTAENDSPSRLFAGGRQLKDTIRNSFRKLRKARTSTSPQTNEESPMENVVNDQKSKVGDTAVEEKISVPTDIETSTAIGDTKSEETHTNEENHVDEETVPTSDEVPSILHHTINPNEAKTPAAIQSIYFYDTYILPRNSSKEARQCSGISKSPSLFVGTHGGILLIHNLSWLECSPVTVTLTKELKFRHAAPILGMCLLDAKTHAPLAESEKNRLIAEHIEKPIFPEESTEKVEQETPTDINNEEKSTHDIEKQQPNIVSDPANDSHELLVCTEQQIRLITLPLFRTKHKYHFWEKTNAASTKSNCPEDHSSSRKVSNDPGVSAEAHTSDENNTNVNQRKQSLNDIETTDEISRQKICAIEQLAFPKHLIAAFGSQSIPHAESTEWNIVLALRDGSTTILTLPNLRRIIKASCCEYSKRILDKLLTPCVADSSNLIFWPLSTGQIVSHEISCNQPQRLVSVILSSGLSGPGYSIALPDWARPFVQSEAVSPTNQLIDITDSTIKAADETIESVQEEIKENVTHAVNAGDNIANDVFTKVGHSIINLDSGVNSISQKIEEITLDNIKDYLNDHGSVTVKNTENSLEKHTVIEGGNVVTTVHEMKKVDGEVVKDDTVQVKCSGDLEPIKT